MRKQMVNLTYEGGLKMIILHFVKTSYNLIQSTEAEQKGASKMSKVWIHIFKDLNSVNAINLEALMQPQM